MRPHTRLGLGGPFLGRLDLMMVNAMEEMPTFSDSLKELIGEKTCRQDYGSQI